MIAMGEANPNSQYGEYGGMHTSIKDAPDVSGMTIGEVKALQRQKVSEGAKSSAAGRYQIINKSMDKYQQEAGLDDEQPFSPDNQDLMVSSYISKHAGNDPEKIANIAASEFASIKNKNGVGNYDGKLNKAKIERSAIVNAVKQDNNPVDYEAIAKKYGGTEALVDYEAIAKKYGGTEEVNPSPTAPLSATRNGKTYTVNNNTLQDDLKAELAANPWQAKQAAMGTAITDLYQGGKQLLGMGDKQALANNKTIRDAHPGYAIGGNVALMAGGGLAPALNTLKGNPRNFHKNGSIMLE